MCRRRDVEASEMHASRLVGWRPSTQRWPDGNLRQLGSTGPLHITEATWSHLHGGSMAYSCVDRPHSSWRRTIASRHAVGGTSSYSGFNSVLAVCRGFRRESDVNSTSASVVDLFAGAGLFDLAFVLEGFTIRRAIEIDVNAAAN